MSMVGLVLGGVLALAHAQSCESKLVDSQAVRILRAMQDLAPTLSADELAAWPAELRGVSAREELPLTPPEFERALERIFGHRIAALEYAGFETLELPNPTDDLPDWNKQLVKQGLNVKRSYKESGSTPRAFLLDWRETDARLLKLWGRRVSTYSLWRAARRLNPEIDLRERLALRAGSVRERKLKLRPLVKALAREPIATKYPGLIHDIDLYLEREGDFNDRLRLIWFLTQRRPDVRWLMDRHDVAAALNARD